MQKLTLLPHLDNVCSSSLKSLGFVMRISKYFSDISLIKKLYYAYVLSKVEYACLIWCPIYASHAIALDKIHRRFLKFLSFKVDGIYPEIGIDQPQLLHRHDMVSLSYRRDQSYAKFVYKLLHNQIDCEFLLSKIPIYVPRISSRSDVSFRPPAARTDVLRRAPINLMCKAADRIFDDIFV